MRIEFVRSYVMRETKRARGVAISVRRPIVTPSPARQWSIFCRD